MHVIEFTDEAAEHLAKLTARDRATVLDAVGRQLLHEPTNETRNRKPMRPNPVAPWELRIGHLRVYYEVSQTPFLVVTVRAIGIKDRSLVRIGDESWDFSKLERGHEDSGDDSGNG